MDEPLSGLQKEVRFKTSRSGGKGGQNVNKVSTKVELVFDIDASALLNDGQKKLLKTKLVKRLIYGTTIQIISEEERSQYLNKQRALEKLRNLIEKALRQPKPRKVTKPKRSAIEERLKDKQVLAMKKINRRKDFLE